MSTSVLFDRTDFQLLTLLSRRTDPLRIAQAASIVSKYISDNRVSMDFEGQDDYVVFRLIQSRIMTYDREQALQQNTEAYPSIVFGFTHKDDVALCSLILGRPLFV